MTTTMRRLLAGFVLAAAAAAAHPGIASAHPTPPPGNACVAAIRAAWPDHLEGRAIAISFRESRWTSVRNRRSMGRKWGAATGCLQILPGVARNIGVRCDLMAPGCNAVAGYTLFRRAGWTPWRVR